MMRFSNAINWILSMITGIIIIIALRIAYWIKENV